MIFVLRKEINGDQCNSTKKLQKYTRVQVVTIKFGCCHSRRIPKQPSQTFKMTVWHTSGVPSAVAQVRVNNSLLVVFTTHVRNEEEEANGVELLSRVSTKVLENRTFNSDITTNALKRHQAICLKMRGTQQDADFANFSALFPVSNTPCIHIVAPDGRVLLQRPFFTSPNSLVLGLDYAAKIRDADANNLPALPDLGPDLHAPKPLSKKTLARLNAQREAAEKAQREAAAEKYAKIAENQKASSTTASDSVERSLPTSQSALQLGDRARLQLRLADGRTPSRSFNAATTTLRDICAWAAEESTPGSAPETVRLSVSFPRRVFDAADGAKTLRELSLVPSATLIVSKVETSFTAASGLVSSGGALLRGAVGVAGSFLGSFVGSTPQPRTDSASQDSEPNERERGRNQPA